MRDQGTAHRKKLNLGIDAIGTVDTSLSWDKLEMCFGSSFRFSAETKFEITRELALQQGRLQKRSWKLLGSARTRRRGGPLCHGDRASCRRRCSVYTALAFPEDLCLPSESKSFPEYYWKLPRSACARRRLP